MSNLNSLTDDLVEMRLDCLTNNSFNYSKFKSLKKSIARIKTQQNKEAKNEK